MDKVLWFLAGWFVLSWVFALVLGPYLNKRSKRLPHD